MIEKQQLAYENTVLVGVITATQNAAQAGLSDLYGRWTGTPSIYAKYAPAQPQDLYRFR
jgi:hypothetical protein